MNRAGVTLIELIVVLAILAIAASFVGPSIFSASRRFTLNSAGRRVVAAVRAARTEARARQQERILALDGGNLVLAGIEGPFSTRSLLPGLVTTPVEGPAHYTALPSGQILGPARLELSLDERYRGAVVLGPGPGAVRFEEIR